MGLVTLVTSGAGPGLDPDSMAYIGAANTLAHDGTLRVPSAIWWQSDSTAPLTRWPPGFSVAMAIPRAMGTPPLTSARIVLAVAAFITAATVVVLLRRTVLRAFGASLAVAGLFATPAILEVHLSVLSEPLFLAALVVTIACMTTRPDKPYFAGAAAAAAVMVRYAGLCAPVAVFLWFLLGNKAPLRDRVTNALKSALVPVIVAALWTARVRHVASDHTGMRIQPAAGIRSAIHDGLGTLETWLVPAGSGATRPFIAIGIAIAIAVILWNAGSRLPSATDETENESAEFSRVLIRASTLMLACYLMILLLSRAFVGHTIPFDNRLFAPAILLAETAIAVSLAVVLHTARKMMKIGVVAIVCAWIGASALANRAIVADAIGDGLDFAGSDWRDSETLDWVRAHGRGRTLFSNWPPAIYFHGGRITRDLPISLDSADIALFRQILEDGNGAIVAFDAPSPDYPPTDSIASALGLTEEARLGDGKIWSPLRKR